VNINKEILIVAVVIFLGACLACFFWGKSYSEARIVDRRVLVHFNEDSAKAEWLIGKVDSIRLRDLARRYEGILDRLKRERKDSLPQLPDQLIPYWAMPETTLSVSTTATVVVGEDSATVPVTIPVTTGVTFIGGPLNIFNNLVTTIKPFNLNYVVPHPPSGPSNSLGLWAMPLVGYQAGYVGAGGIVGYSRVGVGAIGLFGRETMFTLGYRFGD